MPGRRDFKPQSPAAYGAQRTSRQRLAIASAADSLDRAFSAYDLRAAVRRDHPGIGLATIYRAVTAMEASGFIEAVGSREGAAVYARCRVDGHHHHLVCTGCGTVSDTACSLPLDPLVEDPGFKVTGHSFTLYGLCLSCQETGGRPREERPEG